MGLLFGGVLFTGCGSTSTDTTKHVEPNVITTQNVLSSTTIITTNGKAISVDKTEDGFIFKGYEGKIILLEVYGDTCPHCIAAIPSYNAIQAKYPNDVRVIALESYGTLSNIGQQQYETVAKQSTGTMFSMIKEHTGYNLQAVPYLMILSKDGSIVYDEVLSDFPEEVIDTRIKQLL